MKEIPEEIKDVFDFYTWCGDIRYGISYDVYLLIYDQFFIRDLTEGIKLGLK